ncbi:MAG: hypothetical protein ACOY5B_14910 [Spirochaetota bacterium]
MLGDFFRRALQILAIASVGSVLYLDILSVPTGHLVFLQRASGSATSAAELQAYASGYTFVPTLFVPGRWRKFQLETAPRLQEIKIRLPLRYSAYLRLNDLFYVHLRLRIEGEIDPAHATAALAALQMRPTERDRFVEESMQFLAAEYFINVNTDERQLERLKIQLTAFFSGANLPELQKRLDAQLRTPWYRLKNAELREIHVPDSEIYAAQTRNLEQVAAADRRALLTQIEKEAELSVERKRNMEELAKAEKMSALMAENPALLEYYKIEKIAARAGQVILDATSHGTDKRISIIPSNEKESARGRNGNEDKSEAGGEIGGAQRQR